MKSPFTGGEVELRHENRNLTFRKEVFNYIHNYYVCVDTCEEFTTTELDEVNLEQVYNQYRVKYGIPFPDEIKAIRTKYGVSALTMAHILGTGENQYRLYENGEMPSVSIGRMINSIKDKNTFMNILTEAKGSFSEVEYNRIVNKINNATDIVKSPLYYGISRSLQNGYAEPSESKLKNTILYLLDKCGDMGYTKMNKLLFYSDFYSYKKRAKGIIGMPYRAIQYGPAPIEWKRAYNNFDEIDVTVIAMPDGSERYAMHALVPADIQTFSAEEKDILDFIIGRIGNLSATQLTAMSHEELGWLDNQEEHNIIPFNYAFALKYPKP